MKSIHDSQKLNPTPDDYINTYGQRLAIEPELEKRRDGLNQMTATIFLSEKCNMACKYCYEISKRNTEPVSREHIVKFIDFLYTDPHYSSFKKINLDFIGGEPLMEPELIAFAIKTFILKGKSLNHHWVSEKERNFLTFATSNGTLFDTPGVKHLLSNFPFFIVGLSLDGCQKMHDTNRVFVGGEGTHEHIMKNFEWWKNRFRQTGVKGTFNHETLPYLAESLKYQLDLGMMPWCNPTFDETWTKEDAQLFKTQALEFLDYFIKKVPDSLATPTRAVTLKPCNEAYKGEEGGWCGTGRYMITLGTDGSLYPCHRFATNEVHKYAIGHVDTGVDMDKLNKLIEDSKKMKCTDCAQANLCPSCAASNYEIGGGEFKPCLSICEIVKVMNELYTEYQDKEWSKSPEMIHWGVWKLKMMGETLNG